MHGNPLQGVLLLLRVHRQALLENRIVRTMSQQGPLLTVKLIRIHQSSLGLLLADV